MADVPFPGERLAERLAELDLSQAQAARRPDVARTPSQGVRRVLP
jgi:hypothetical protein